MGEQYIDKQNTKILHNFTGLLNYSSVVMQSPSGSSYCGTATVGDFGLCASSVSCWVHNVRHGEKQNAGLNGPLVYYSKDLLTLWWSKIYPLKHNMQEQTTYMQERSCVFWNTHDSLNQEHNESGAQHLGVCASKWTFKYLLP